MGKLTDEWATPDDVYERICQIWRTYPDVDLFASAENTKCKLFLSETDNALIQDWTDIGTVGWMNPPYSQPIMTMAIEKAIQQSELGFTTLFLLPAWVDQKWYHRLIKRYPHQFWEGRIAHSPPVGVKPSSPRYGSIHGLIYQSR